MGMHVDRMGSAELVRVGLRHRRGRTDRECSLVYGERCDPQRVAQIFSRAHDCVGSDVSVNPDFRQVRLSTH